MTDDAGAHTYVIAMAEELAEAAKYWQGVAEQTAARLAAERVRLAQYDALADFVGKYLATNHEAPRLAPGARALLRRLAELTPENPDA